MRLLALPVAHYLKVIQRRCGVQMRGGEPDKGTDAGQIISEMYAFISTTSLPLVQTLER